MTGRHSSMVNSGALGQISDFEIRLLRVFLAVVDCGGFSAAEGVLNISRPTISTHIANLEARLNLTLCHRGRAGFSLTDEGAVVYDEATLLLEHLERFRNRVNNLCSSPAGRLSVALSDTFSLDSRCRLPQVISAFSRQAPNVELVVSVRQMEDIERMVFSGELDVGFIPYHRKLAGLQYTHLYTDYNYLYCGREHPLYDMRDDEITDAVVNSTPLVHAGLKPHQEVYQNLANMNLAGTSYHYESRIAMVLSGQYICFLPEAVAQPHVERGELKAIATALKSFPLGVAVVTRKTVKHNRVHAMFLTAIEAAFSDQTGEAPY